MYSAPEVHNLQPAIFAPGHSVPTYFELLQYMTYLSKPVLKVQNNQIYFWDN